MQQSRQTRPAARIVKRCAPKKLSIATELCLRCTAPSPWRARAAGAGFVTPPSRTKLIRLILLSMAVTGEQMTELCSMIRKDQNSSLFISSCKMYNDIAKVVAVTVIAVWSGLPVSHSHNQSRPIVSGAIQHHEYACSIPNLI